MAVLNSNFKVRWETRMCMVEGELGYFHTWEQYCKSTEDRSVSRVYGIVEFGNAKVRRVDPTLIQFCDSENVDLAMMNREIKKYEEEENTNG